MVQWLLWRWLLVEKISNRVSARSVAFAWSLKRFLLFERVFLWVKWLVYEKNARIEVQQFVLLERASIFNPALWHTALILPFRPRTLHASSTPAWILEHELRIPRSPNAAPHLFPTRSHVARGSSLFKGPFPTGFARPASATGKRLPSIPPCIIRLAPQSSHVFAANVEILQFCTLEVKARRPFLFMRLANFTWF